MTTAEIVGDSGGLSTFATAGRAWKKKIISLGEREKLPKRTIFLAGYWRHLARLKNSSKMSWSGTALMSSEFI